MATETSVRIQATRTPAISESWTDVHFGDYDDAGTTASISGLIPDTKYYFRARLETGSSIGDWSDGSDHVKTSGLNLAANDATTTTVTVAWDEVASVTSVTLRYWTDPGNRTSVTMTGDLSEGRRTAMLTGLLSDMTYSLTISAITAAGTGDESGEVTFATMPPRPGIPTISFGTVTPTSIQIIVTPSEEPE